MVAAIGLEYLAALRWNPHLTLPLAEKAALVASVRYGKQEAILEA